MRKVDNLTASKWTDDRPFSRMQISATVSLLAQGESLGLVIPNSRLQGALRRPSRALDQSWRVLKVMTAYILRMALYWY